MPATSATKYYLLLGAGFSRNWGGWLAADVFEFLISDERIRLEPDLLKLLWEQQTSKGGTGFEGALEKLQRKNYYNPTPENVRKLNTLHTACVEAIQFMDQHLVRFDHLGTFDISPMKGIGLISFLQKFDAVFSLNQDTILERNYAALGPEEFESSVWRGAYTPGVPKIAAPVSSDRELTLISLPSSAHEEMQADLQPIFKLHGSWNWIEADENRGAIFGGYKTDQIGKSPLLANYHGYFGSVLRDANARLLIIGYGFRDEHINEVIKSGCKAGLKLSIIDPNGHRAIFGGAEGPANEITEMELALIGVSKRSLTSIFTNDLVEIEKIYRFFN